MTVSEDGRIFSASSVEFLIKVHDRSGNIFVPFTIHIKGQYYIGRTLWSGPEAPSLDAIKSVDLPDRWPALHTMLIDDENRLWIAAIVDEREVYRWCVLSEKGKLLARFDWPRDHPIEDVKNGNLYSVETSEETGERNVIRYRINLSSK